MIDSLQPRTFTDGDFMRVLIVDDHPLYCLGVKALLTTLDPDVQVDVAANVEECVALADAEPPIDLVLLDMKLPGTSRLDALSRVKGVFEEASVVVVSGEEDLALILQAIEAGAAGYIPKSTDPAVTIQALRLVLAHGIYLPPEAFRLMADARVAPPVAPEPRAPAGGVKPELSDRQAAVLHRLLQGKSNKVIARELSIAEGTVKAHLWAVYQLLGVNSRAQAMCRVHELGMLEQMR
jgi:DNA-binding NarL/FixJ family response regulator